MNNEQLEEGNNLSALKRHLSEQIDIWEHTNAISEIWVKHDKGRTCKPDTSLIDWIVLQQLTLAKLRIKLKKVQEDFDNL